MNKVVFIGRERETMQRTMNLKWNASQLWIPATHFPGSLHSCYWCRLLLIWRGVLWLWLACGRWKEIYEKSCFHCLMQFLGKLHTSMGIICWALWIQNYSPNSQRHQHSAPFTNNHRLEGKFLRQPTKPEKFHWIFVLSQTNTVGKKLRGNHGNTICFEVYLYSSLPQEFSYSLHR